VEAIRLQQDHVREHCPDGSAWLFPSRSDPDQPVPYETLRKAFASWQERIGLHDKTGCAATVTIHQFRHTFGTRLINSGVPQHVIQRLLGRASPDMTAVYARLHDTTIRAEFERYRQTRVDVQVPACSASIRRRSPRTASGSNTDSPAPPTPCPTATAAGRPSRTARTPMHV